MFIVSLVMMVKIVGIMIRIVNTTNKIFKSTIKFFTSVAENPDPLLGPNHFQFRIMPEINK